MKHLKDKIKEQLAAAIREDMARAKTSLLDKSINLAKLFSDLKAAGILKEVTINNEKVWVIVPQESE